MHVLEGAREARGLEQIIMRRDEKRSFIFWTHGHSGKSRPGERSYPRKTLKPRLRVWFWAGVQKLDTTPTPV